MATSNNKRRRHSITDVSLFCEDGESLSASLASRVSTLERTLSRKERECKQLEQELHRLARENEALSAAQSKDAALCSEYQHALDELRQTTMVLRAENEALRAENEELRQNSMVSELRLSDRGSVSFDDHHSDAESDKRRKSPGSHTGSSHSLGAGKAHTLSSELRLPRQNLNASDATGDETGDTDADAYVYAETWQLMDIQVLQIEPLLGYMYSDGEPSESHSLPLRRQRVHSELERRQHHRDGQSRRIQVLRDKVDEIKAQSAKYRMLTRRYVDKYRQQLKAMTLVKFRRRYGVGLLVLICALYKLFRRLHT